MVRVEIFERARRECGLLYMERWGALVPQSLLGTFTAFKFLVEASKSELINQLINQVVLFCYRHPSISPIL